MSLLNPFKEFDKGFWNIVQKTSNELVMSSGIKPCTEFVNRSTYEKYR